jgi:transcriptional regulator with XRE-family HTH domain
MQRLGEKLRLLRQRYGMTVRELANTVDVSYSNIAGIERGISKPSLDLLAKLAELYEVSYDQLLDDKLEVISE